MIIKPFDRRRELLSTAVEFRRTFRTWRGERPFWAGVFTFAAGLPILYWPYANLDLGGVPLALSTTSGAGSLVIGTLLLALGVALWYGPHLRAFAGIATLLLAVISFPVANFGGLFLGAASGLIGGSLACAWMPPTADEPSTPPGDRTAAPVPAGEGRSDT
ncbi:DUF6114 domain-containing protein [Streptomyces roseochromogenus]|uniref:Integral membrane protein n=1 Tax=Streptomyces roseochromogenus subsp. oscitans DS 12.976 TaxID=1352936 RepID=V6JJL4_STRRC|nr:DUF6114 domain-containing protein [Streptomyces roseochromogenus]EST20040.1 hypothetical protein M878_40225 [Streptomyces roseochromogenus subsp. oscitans DS 12.976]